MVCSVGFGNGGSFRLRLGIIAVVLIGNFWYLEGNFLVDLVQRVEGLLFGSQFVIGYVLWLS